MPENLKLCPFCGSYERPNLYSYEEEGQTWWAISCDRCPAEMDDAIQSKEEATRAWNRRTITHTENGIRLEVIEDNLREAFGVRKDPVTPYEHGLVKRIKGVVKVWDWT